MADDFIFDAFQVFKEKSIVTGWNILRVFARSTYYVSSDGN